MNTAILLPAIWRAGSCTVVLVFFARSFTVTVGDWPGTSLMTTVASNQMFGRSGTARWEDYRCGRPRRRRSQDVRVDHSRFTPRNRKFPSRSSVPVAAHDVQLGKPGPT